MKDDIVLQAEGLSKCFKIYSNPWDRAREWASFGRRRFHRPFHALKNISFEVRRGEFFGVIGQNGAGKSTLLKVLTGILDPTEGSYRTNGRVLSLLELGTDFNGHLSARQNIVRSTELLGFPEGYVRDRMGQIEEFSELGEFFDRPVRLYSSGMRSRLAFSMFAFLECDLLILDEVLAVGDIFFKQKCFARLEKLIAGKTSIILVTHGMSVVRQFCDRVLLLDKGREIHQGKPDEAICIYQQIKGRKNAALVMSMPEEDVAACGPAAADKAEESFWPSEEVFAPVDFSEKEQKARVVRFAVCNDKCEPCTTFKQGEQVCFLLRIPAPANDRPPCHGHIGLPTSSTAWFTPKNVLHHGVVPSVAGDGRRTGPSISKGDPESGARSNM